MELVDFRPRALKVGEVDFRTDFQLLRPMVQLRDHLRDGLVRHRRVKVELLEVEFQPHGQFRDLVISRADSAFSWHSLTSSQRQNVLDISALRRGFNLFQHNDLKHNNFNFRLVDFPNCPMVRLLQLAIEIRQPFQRGQAYVSPVPALAFGMASSFSKTRERIHFAAAL